jgi:hypothetical protein
MHSEHIVLLTEIWAPRKSKTRGACLRRLADGPSDIICIRGSLAMDYDLWITPAVSTKFVGPGGRDYGCQE